MAGRSFVDERREQRQELPVEIANFDGFFLFIRSGRFLAAGDGGDMADLRNSSGDGRMEAREKGVEMENGREREREREEG